MWPAARDKNSWTTDCSGKKLTRRKNSLNESTASLLNEDAVVDDYGYDLDLSEGEKEPPGQREEDMVKDTKNWN